MEEKSLSKIIEETLNTANTANTVNTVSTGGEVIKSQKIELGTRQLLHSLTSEVSLGVRYELNQQKLEKHQEEKSDHSKGSNDADNN